MKKKKNVAVLLISGLIFCTAALSACGGNSVPYDPDNFLPEGTAENPYQIVKEAVTLNIFVPRGSLNPPYESMEMFKILSELTNLKFDFTEVDTSAYTSVRSAAWEDKKNLPDLFLFNNSISEQVIYSQYGALVAFNDDNLEAGGVKAGNLIDNYMPVYKQLLDANFNIETSTSAKEVAMLEDGYMYSTLSVNDVPRDLTFKMYINQQWIENLREDGVTMPDGAAIPDADDIATVEEYVDILRLFKKYDANHNGKKDDEIPVTAKELEYLRNFILASYGYVTNGAELENDGSGVAYVPQTEAYKKYLETMSVMYGEGLLDQSNFSIKTDAQMAVKGLDGDASRLGSFCAAAAYIIVGEDRADEYTTFGPLTSDYYNEKPLQWGFSYFQPTGAVIPTGTPYVREIARLLDILYSDLGCQLIAYGKEGIDWTWDDEGQTSWTFHVPDDWTGTQEEYRATITPNVGTASALYWKYDFVGKMNDKTITQLNRLSERYMPYLKEQFPQEIKLSSTDYNDVELITSGVDAYIKNMEYNFITGKKDLKKDWNSYLNDLSAYNVDKLAEIYDKAYQAYKKTH